MRARATIATPGRCSRPGRAASSPTPSPAPVRRCATPRRDRRPSRSRPRSSSCARLEAALREEQEASASQPGTKRFENLTTLLAQTKAEYLTQAHAFLARYPQYKAQFIDQQTVDPKALAKFADRLPSGTLAIQYFAAPDTLYLFVVAPGGSFQVRSRAIAQEDLYKLVKEYRQHLDAATTERLPWVDDGSAVYREKVVPLREVSRKLSALLLEPVAPELATHRNLVLIPNDMLLYLPIHALTLADRDGSVRFLVETHVVSYVTQLELVDLLTPSMPETNVPLLAVANPDGSLPAASREVRDLARLRPGATALEGAQATKERFLSLASQFPDVHLATHGVLDAERPERSYLLLAGADEASQRSERGRDRQPEPRAQRPGRAVGVRDGAGRAGAGRRADDPGRGLQPGGRAVGRGLALEGQRRDHAALHGRLSPGAGDVGRAAALQQAQLTDPAPAGDRASVLLGAVHPHRRALAGSALYRQGEREGRSCADPTLDRESATVQLDELP